MDTVIRAYVFALDPTPAQAETFRSHCGAQRYAYNFGLALVAPTSTSVWPSAVTASLRSI